MDVRYLKMSLKSEHKSDGVSPSQSCLLSFLQNLYIYVAILDLQDFSFAFLLPFSCYNSDSTTFKKEAILTGHSTLVNRPYLHARSPTLT